MSTEFTNSGAHITVTSSEDTVRLQRLRPSDAARYFELIAYDPSHLRQYGDTTADKYQSVQDVAKGILLPPNPFRYRFGIWDEKTMVGTNNVTMMEGSVAEVGSWVGKEYIGNGYASRARALLVDFAFEVLNIDRIYSRIVVGNEPSRRSVEKSGFTYVGEEREGSASIWRFVLERA